MLAPFAGLCGSWLCSASFLQIFDLVVQVLAVLLGPRHVLLPASDVLLGLVQLLAENRHLSFQFGDSGSFEVDRVLDGGCAGVAGMSSCSGAATADEVPAPSFKLDPIK